MTDIDMIGRIAAACAWKRLDAELVDMWTACSGSWGVRSPAALGCLLELARAAWGDPDLVTSSDGTAWMVLGDKTFIAATEDDALVAALEAAPFEQLTAKLAEARGPEGAR